MNQTPNMRQQEVDANYEHFKSIRPEIMATQKDRFALLQNRKVLGYFDTRSDALKAGRALKQEYFSVQKVSDEAVELGDFSHVDSLV